MVQFSTNEDPINASDRETRSAGRASRTTQREKRFTVSSANLMLPFLARVVRDVMSLSKDVDQQDEQIRRIENLPKPNKIVAFAEELKAIKDSFGVDRERLDACRLELASLGVSVDSVQAGVVNFPAELGHQPVLLCWRLGESAVTHYHQIGESYDDRREIGSLKFDASEPELLN